MRANRFLVAVSILSIACFTGCGTLNKGTVDNPSPYGGITPTGELITPNKILYDADVTITTAFTGLDQFLKWEKENRTAINSPEMKRAADKIRVNAPAWFRSALVARDAYAAAATAANKSALQKALDVLQAAIAEANKWRITVSPPG